AQLAGQHGIDHAMALQPALPPEHLRHDIEAEMALPARPMAGMAHMLLRFVDHANAFRSESFGQLSCDQVGKAHGVRLQIRRMGRFGRLESKMWTESGFRQAVKAGLAGAERLAADSICFA